MTATLTFEPLSDSEQHFEPIEIDLHVENQAYLVGFTKHPLALAPSQSQSNAAPNSEDESESAVTRDGLRSRHMASASHHSKPGAATTSEYVSDVGFSEGLVDRKLCIVPIPDKPAKVKELAKTMGTMYAAIWLAPGYKVMLVPAGGSKIYYQRAIPGNPRWRKISKGHGIDLADPLMSVLDNAIHIKIDIRPDEPPASALLLNKVIDFIEWYKNHSKPSGTTSSSPASAAPPKLIDKVHTEITGTKVHDPRRFAYQVAARVSVQWEPNDEELKERLREEPERGNFHELRAQRKKTWKEKEMEIENLDRMELEVNPFASASASDTNTKTDREANSHERALSLSAVGEVDDSSKEKQLPSIPEQPHESKQGANNDDSENTPTRPSCGRSKSNTAKSPPQSRETSPDSNRSKDSRKANRCLPSPSSSRRATKNP